MKNGYITFFLLFCAGALYAQQSKDQSIVGRWEMKEIIQDGVNMTEEHNPNGDRYIEFNTDGTFISGGTPMGKNFGRFFVNDLSAMLYIDSAAGPDDDSVWIIDFKEDLLIWKGVGTEWAEKFMIHLKRSDP